MIISSNSSVCTLNIKYLVYVFKLRFIMAIIFLYILQIFMRYITSNSIFIISRDQDLEHSVNVAGVICGLSLLIPKTI
jgi:hypothetical protein